MTALTVATAVVAAAGPSEAASGDLDTGFGTNGWVSVADAAAVVWPQGERVVVRTTSGLRRYARNGSVDTGFGTAGSLADSQGSLLSVRDGVILAVGAIDGRPAVRRYTADGKPDPAFGSQGMAVLPFPGRALEALPQGSALLVSALRPVDDDLAPDGTNGDQMEPVLLRLLPSGLPDPEFGIGGEIVGSVGTFAYDPYCGVVTVGVTLFWPSVTPEVHPERAYCDPADPSNWLRLGAGVGWSTLMTHGDGILYRWGDEVLRLLRDGLPDPAFAPIPLRLEQLVHVLPDNRLLLAEGWDRTAPHLLFVDRHLANGLPDPTAWNQQIPLPDGRRHGGDRLRLSGVASDGSRTLLTGWRWIHPGHGHGFVLRLGDDLRPDPTFGIDGWRLGRRWNSRTTPADPGRYVTITDVGLESRLSDGGPRTNLAPTASFTAACSGWACTFDSGASSDPDGSIHAASWSVVDKCCDYAMGRTFRVAADSSSWSTFTVELAVEDDQGDIVRHRRTVSLPAPYEAVTLKASVAKTRSGKTVSLTWTNTGELFDVLRNSSLVAREVDGAWVDANVGPSGTFRYRVCRAADQSSCSNEVTVTL